MQPKIDKISASRIVSNTGQIAGLPKNPRVIRDEKFERLKQSIADDPEFMEIRPLIVIEHNKKFVIIGGNMRFRAAVDLGWNEIPCVIIPNDTPVEKLRAYTIKDNNGFGEWNWESLGNEWNVDDLVAWGVDIDTNFDVEPEPDDLIGDDKNKPITMKLTFANVEQLRKMQTVIDPLLNETRFDGVTYSVSGGEL